MYELGKLFQEAERVEYDLVSLNKPKGIVTPTQTVKKHLGYFKPTLNED